MQKRTLTLCLAFLYSITTMCQFSALKAMQKEHFSKEMMDQLKATTTVFFYSSEQKSDIGDIKMAITEGWTLTPLIFDEISNFEKYAVDPKYSYFVIEGYRAESSSSGSSIHYYLNLRLFKEVSKKGKISTTGLCRIELYPNTQSMMMSYGKKDEVITNLYTKGAFYNWSPILLKAQLEVVATNLENNYKPGHYEEFKDDNLTNILSSDTLYVPKSLLMSFNAFSGKENEKPETIFNGYRYKYRICTDEELFDIFEISKRGRLLFEYVKSSTDKFITIYDLKQKKAIYRNYVAVSYNLKSKDIESIK